MIKQLLQDYSIISGALRTQETGYIAFAKDELAQERVEHSFFLVFHQGNWLWPTNEDRVDWSTTSVTVVKEPKEQALFMGLWGDIYRVGSGDVQEEAALASIPDGPKSFGPLRCIRAIDGRAYAVGMGRQVYVRKGMDSWERMDAGVRTDRQHNDVNSFETIHGLTASCLYAAGRRGEIWRYDAARWVQEDSPTNRIITDLWCAPSGDVFACGMGGTLLVRRGGVWRFIDHEATEDDFWSVREFNGRVYLATMRAVYELSGNSVTPTHFGADAPETCFTLSVAGNLLWSIGAKNVFSFDGTRWTRMA